MSDLSWVLDFRHPSLTTIFWCFSQLVSVPAIMAFCSYGYWSWDRKFYRDLGILLGLTAVTNVMLKGYFAVSRPTIEHLVSGHYDYSFPSGHATAITVAALAIAAHYKTKPIWFASIIAILGCCASRVYLGVHFPSDILGGVVTGMLTVTAYRLLRTSSIWITFSRKKHLVLPTFLTALTFYFLFLTKDIVPLNASAAAAVIGLLIGDSLSTKYLKFQKITNKLHQLIVGFTAFALLAPLALASVLLPNFTNNLLIHALLFIIIGISCAYWIPMINAKLFKSYLSGDNVSPGFKVVGR